MYDMITVKNIGIGDQLVKKVLITYFFQKMCPISVGSVHNFGRSDGDIF